MARHKDWGWVLGSLFAAANLAIGAEMSGAFFVAPDGSDQNAGTREKPFGTLERARDAVRTLKAGGLPKGGVTVWLRGGLYERTRTFELGQEDSGTPESPIVYRAVPGEEVRICGGHAIRKFAPVTDPDALKRLSPAARDKALQVDLKAEGVSEFGALERRGMNVAIRPMWAELFFQERPMTLARWPNRGWTTIAKADGPSGEYDFGAKGPGKFTYSGDRPQGWAAFDDILVHGCWTYDWADSYERVKTIDVARREVSTEPPHGVYGYRKGGRFYFLNVLEELDEPEEWYLDRRKGRLYFWPPGAIDGGKAVLSLLGETLVVLKDVAHVTLRGLTLECSRGSGVQIVGGSNNLVAGCTIRNLGNVAVSIGEDIEHFHARWYKDPLWNRNGGTNNGVQGCDLYGLGEGGIMLGGGDRGTLTPAGNFAVNNDIFDFSRIGRTYKHAVFVQGVGNRIAHNRMHNARHSAIGFAGNDHMIELNDIYRVCLDTDDAGAIHQGRDWTWRGIVFRHNLFHDFGKSSGRHGVYGIYLDDLMSGALIQGNVFYGVNSPIFINGGRDNIVSNNIFVNCAQIVRCQRMGGSEQIVMERLKLVNPEQPPYSVRYPELTGLAQDPRRFQPVNNVLVGNVCAGARGAPADVTNSPMISIRNNFTAAAAMFAGVRERNFQLKDDSPVYQAIPGFQKIPFEKIGLYQDEYRTSVPSRHAGSGRPPVRDVKTRQCAPSFSTLERGAELPGQGEWSAFAGRTGIMVGQGPIAGAFDPGTVAVSRGRDSWAAIWHGVILDPARDIVLQMDACLPAPLDRESFFELYLNRGQMADDAAFGAALVGGNQATGRGDTVGARRDSAGPRVLAKDSLTPGHWYRLQLRIPANTRQGRLWVQDLTAGEKEPRAATFAEGGAEAALTAADRWAPELGSLDALILRVGGRAQAANIILRN